MSHAAPGTPPPPDRPLDWTMDLLNQIKREAVDPEYASVAAGPRPARPRARWPIAVVAFVVGVLVAAQGTLTVRAAPEADAERRDLIARIQAADERNSQLLADQEAVAADVRALQQSAGQGTTGGLAEVEPVVGTQAVAGPGITVLVDDKDPSNPSGRVLDVDLRRLVNGLWAAGAEVVAINGIRLTAKTAIRSAGSAITVDYRSLVHPYRIEAIGDPLALQAAFVRTPGGVWWQGLKENYGFRYEVSPADRIRIAGTPGLTIRYVAEGG